MTALIINQSYYNKCRKELSLIIEQLYIELTCDMWSQQGLINYLYRSFNVFVNEELSLQRLH